MGLEHGLARSDTFQGHHIRQTAKFFEHTSGKKKLVKIGLFFRQITEASKIQVSSTNLFGFQCSLHSGIPVVAAVFSSCRALCRLGQLSLFALLRIATLRLLTNKVVEARAAELVSVRRQRLPAARTVVFKMTKKPPRINSLADKVLESTLLTTQGKANFLENSMQAFCLFFSF